MQNRLEALQPYVIGVRFFQGLPVVDVIFKEKWVVPDSEIINKEKGEGEDNYYYFYSQREGIGIDELLDHAESIINLNIEKEKKNELFKVKINELKVLFQNNSLVKLENMKFVLGSPITTEFNPEEISFDEPVEETKPEPKPKPVLEAAGEVELNGEKHEIIDLDAQQNGQTVHVNNTKVELPPKKKIELEDHSMKQGDGVCRHPAGEFCDNCMDNV